MDMLRNMTEETVKRLNEILKSTIRWLDNQSDHLEWERAEREWRSENDSLNGVEAGFDFDWEFSEDWA